MINLKLAGFFVLVCTLMGSTVFILQNNNTNYAGETADITSTTQIARSKETPSNSMAKLNTSLSTTENASPCIDNQASSDMSCDIFILMKLKSKSVLDSLIGLQLVWRFFDKYKNHDDIKKQINYLTIDEDWRIAKLSQFILYNFDDKPPDIEISTNQGTGDHVEESYQSITASSMNASLLDDPSAIQLDDIQGLLSSNNVFIRLKAVEIAAIQADKRSIDLLKQATKDTDTNIRHIAVASLGGFIEQGLADPEDILNSLIDNRYDPDSEIADLTNELFKQYQQELE